MVAKKNKKSNKKANKKANNKKAGQNQWEDHLTRRARSEGYPARSIYKLEEIQKKQNHR